MPDKRVMQTKAGILGFARLGYDDQRVIFKKAHMLGWTVPEPPILGSERAYEVLDAALDFLLLQKVAFRKER